MAAKEEKRRWWDYAIVPTASAAFISLGVHAVLPRPVMDMKVGCDPYAMLVLSLGAGGWSLWCRTRFC